MTREEIVKKLQVIRRLLPDLKDRETIDEAIYIIDRIEVIEQRLTESGSVKDDWVPIEGSRPTNMSSVLVTVIDDNGERYTSTDRYDVVDDAWLFDENRNVVAWQPFPKPYTGGDKDE